MKRGSRFVTKPSAASARDRHEKDILRRDHRRGYHTEAPNVRCPSCHSDGSFDKKEKS